MRFSHPTAALTLAIAICSSAELVPQQQATPPTFRAGADLVRVDFVVTDKSDRSVEGLSATDFVVKEDGKARPIVAFEAVAAGHISVAPDANAGAEPLNTKKSPAAVPSVSTIVLVDDFHLTLDQAARLRPPLKSLVTTVGEPTGGLMLVAPGSHVSLLAERPTDVASLLPVVDRIVGKPVDREATFPISDAEALAIARRDEPTLTRVISRFIAINPQLAPDDAKTIAIDHGTHQAHDVRVRRGALYDQAIICLDWIANRPGRHSLIIVSGGFPTDEDDSKYDDVITRSLRANAPIDFLDARGLSGFNPYHDVENSVLLNRQQDEGPTGRSDDAAGTTALAVDTGGIVISNTNDFERGFHRLLDMMNSYYILAYERPSHGKPGFHKIKVEARPKGLHVRARRGYFAATYQ